MAIVNKEIVVISQSICTFCVCFRKFRR